MKSQAIYSREMQKLMSRTAQALAKKNLCTLNIIIMVTYKTSQKDGLRGVVN